MGTHHKQYDDEMLALDIAHGTMTQAQIAEKHGLAETTICAIARGERRPELQERIEAATQGMIDQARRLASRLATPALGRLASLIGDTADAPADIKRKAAVDILKYALGDPSRAVNINANLNEIGGPKVLRTPLAGPDMIEAKVVDDGNGSTDLVDGVPDPGDNGGGNGRGHVPVVDDDPNVKGK